MAADLSSGVLLFDEDSLCFLSLKSFSSGDTRGVFLNAEIDAAFDLLFCILVTFGIIVCYSYMINNDEVCIKDCSGDKFKVIMAPVRLLLLWGDVKF